jgi:hypothetical protein
MVSSFVRSRGRGGTRPTDHSVCDDAGYVVEFEGFFFSGAGVTPLPRGCSAVAVLLCFCAF